MKRNNRAYRVDTCNLTFAERSKVEQLLDTACWMYAPFPENTYVFVAFTSRSAEEFAAIPFPDGCIVTDVTGQTFPIHP